MPGNTPEGPDGTWTTDQANNLAHGLNPDGSPVASGGSGKTVYDAAALKAAGKIPTAYDANGGIIAFADDPNVANNPAKDPALKQQYFGLPLYDDQGNPIGHLVDDSLKHRVVLVKPDGMTEVWTGGTAVTGDMHAVNLNDKGEVVGTPRALDLGGSGGSGGGSTHVASPYGYTAPDPTGAASLISHQYDQQIANGKLTVEQAAAAFDREWNAIVSNSNIDTSNVSNKLTADTTNANVGARYMEAGQTRAANIASAQGNMDQQATERAKILAALLPTRLPDGVGMNVQGAGVVPINRVNVDQLLNQGLPSLQSQYGGLQSLFPAIGQAPTVTPGLLDHITMPQQPAMWTPPPPPDISDLINRAANGSAPLGWA